MNKRDFVKALASGNLDEALRIKEALNSKENQANLFIAHYPEPLPKEPTKEQQREFDKFCKKTQRENPDKNIVYITIVERKQPE